MKQSPIQRLYSKLDIQPWGCWIFRGWVDKDGYGQFWLNGRNEKAHRASYMLFVGEIEEGLEIDHLCQMPSCCFPDHLEPVSRRINLDRIQERKNA